MKFAQPLQQAFFLKRYKRFLVDVELANGKVITVHCPNTGRMTGCLSPGCEVLISKSDNLKRKYPHTLEMTKISKTWIGVNTARTNNLVREAIEKEIIQEIGPVDLIKPEVTTSPGHRLDFLLIKGDQKIYIEVKNCTLVENDTAMFPDAVTERGTKHLHELIRLREEGHQAIIFFCVQRMDAKKFSPAALIDPIYAKALHLAVRKGVSVLAYQAKIQPPKIIELTTKLPVILKPTSKNCC
jgi:sugar fermentation stimulation protein A